MSTTRYVTLISIPLLSLSGCLKRTEKISIMSDGSGNIEMIIKGDRADVQNGDAMPTSETGWEINDQLETKDNGDKEITRTAVQHFPAGQVLPASFAIPGTRAEQLALQFPTTLTIEEREDGTYYHFKRVYTQRPFAFVHYWEQETLESDEFKSLVEKKPPDMTQQEKEKFVRALITMDKRMTASFIESVFGGFEERVPQDALLHAHGRALQVYDSEELDLFGRAFEIMTTEEPDDRQHDLEDEVRQRVLNALRSALEEKNVQPAVVGEFIERYELSRDRYRVTEDLGDEQWSIVLSMPGQLVKHNSLDPRLSEQLEDKRPQDSNTSGNIEITVRDGDGRMHRLNSGSFQVAWSFDGKALRDRNVILMATSFVPREPEVD